jgi:hypothetical protein
MTEATAKKRLGIFRREVLTAEMRLAAKKRNDAAMGSAYIETARKLMSEYPQLTLDERKQQFDCLKHDIKLRKMRTRRDDSYVLGKVGRILDIR